MSTNATAALKANAAFNAIEAISALDLGAIKMKLMHVESGEGWSAAYAGQVEAEYRRFLFLMKKYPDSEASPTVDVDTFWHYHILDTMKYARDCEAVFGYFLHHYPYVGIGADAGEDDHADGGERMRAIYEAEFGAGSALQDAFAFCSSPGKPANDATAFCSSPGVRAATAFCSSPGTKAATAFCSSPGTKTATAFCSSPGAKAATAFCSSPAKPGEGASVATAFCSSPSKPRKSAAGAFAFCSSPGKPREIASAATAFCSSPAKPRVSDKAAFAFCSSPGKPRKAANAATAFCSSPAKPAQMQAA